MAKKPVKQAVVAKPVKAKGSTPNFAPRSGLIAAQTLGVKMLKWQKVMLANPKRTAEQRAQVADMFIKYQYDTMLNKRSSKHKLVDEA